MILFSLPPKDRSNRAEGFGSWRNLGDGKPSAVKLIYTINGNPQQTKVQLTRTYWINNTNSEIRRQEYRLVGTTNVLMIYYIPRQSTQDFIPKALVIARLRNHILELPIKQRI